MLLGTQLRSPQIHACESGQPLLEGMVVEHLPQSVSRMAPALVVLADYQVDLPSAVYSIEEEPPLGEVLHK